MLLRKGNKSRNYHDALISPCKIQPEIYRICTHFRGSPIFAVSAKLQIAIYFPKSDYLALLYTASIFAFTSLSLDKSVNFRLNYTGQVRSAMPFKLRDLLNETILSSGLCKPMKRSLTNNKLHICRFVSVKWQIAEHFLFHSKPLLSNGYNYRIYISSQHYIKTNSNYIASHLLSS